MRVGIDARCLSKQLTGIGYCCLSIIKELQEADIEIFLFSPSAINIDFKKNVTVVNSGLKGTLGRQIWAELFLPFLLKKYSLDVFWGPAHRIPLLTTNKLPCVLTIHDLVWLKVPETMAFSTRILERYLMPPSLKKADLILADSKSTMDDISENYPIYLKKIRHTPIGPGSVSTHLPSQSCNLIDKPYILFVGTLEPRKNLARTLEAFSLLGRELRERYYLVLAGGKGWGKIDLPSEISRLGIQDSVLILGYQSTEQLYWLYKNAYGVIFPSLYEGFGLPILEANNFGVPVITSNLSSMPEVGGDAAIIVNPYLVEDIFQGFRRLLLDEALRAELSRKAVANAAKYSWKKTSDLMIKAFKDAISLNEQSKNEKNIN